MNFDFMAAKLKHTSWKLHLRDFLDGRAGLTAAQATSHRDCELGKWLYTEGLAKYGSIPEMKLLVAEHEQLHATVRSVLDFKAAGQKAEAEATYVKIDPISKRLVALLAAVEAAVKQHA